ncbi:20045_t:CDS:1, partial [Funneliformis geosporum]
DLESIVSNEEFSTILKKEGKVRPIWILLVDGRPDKNPKHMKNIIQYAHLFCALDLDYLTIRTHALVQSVYNPIKHSIASLSAKLASITIPVGEFGSHLNSQEKVVDEVLAQRNFEYSGKKLCDIWKRDDIHGKPVMVEYVDQERHPFNDPKPSIS